MAGRDDWSSNPFADPSPTSPSPFSDPSITEATNRRTSEDYNPFGGGPRPTPTMGGASSSAGTGGSYYGDDKEERLRARERELEERAARLEEREREIEENIRVQMKKDRVPNWPKFPDWCGGPFRPFVYHSIEDDIPPVGQKLVTGLYYLWHAFAGLLLWDFFASVMVLLFCDHCDSRWGNFIVSIFLFVILTPVSFNFWYMTIYNGFRKDRSINFFLFFIIFGFQILMALVFAIGPPSTGAAGWYNAFTVNDHSTFAAVFYFLGAIAWTAFTGACVFYFQGVHHYYRTSGNVSLSNAQSEAFSAAAGSSTVQEGVKASILNNAV